VNGVIGSRVARKNVLIAAGLVAGLLFVAVGQPGSYTIFMLTTIFMYACLASSLDLLVGLAGRMSFAHGAFFGIGAYACALTMIHWHLSFPVAALAGVVATALIALPLGVMTMRLAGMYFALATTALGVSFASVIELNNIVGTTGGASGLVGIPAVSYLSTPKQFYLLFLVLLGLGLVAKLAITESRIGSRLVAQRDDEELALTLGVRTNGYKVFAFVVSSGLAGLTGACYALFFGSLAPSDFDIWSSFNVVVWVLVGGAGTLLGPLLGAGLLWTVPQQLNWNPNVDLIIYGFLLIVVITLRRGGIMGILSSGLRTLRSYLGRRNKPGQQESPGSQTRGQPSLAPRT
jgi:branched-chain amino acid transport system permease protein